MVKKEKDTGYTLMAKLRFARSMHHLSATDQALFYELVAIANVGQFPNIFQCSAGALCAALCISPNTLVKSIENLIKANLILYKSGKSRQQFSSFSFKTPSTTISKTDIDTEGVADFFNSTPAGTHSKSDTDVDQNLSTIINSKLINKNNPAGIKPAVEKKAAKKPIKKAEPVINKTDHWQKMVDLWFTFYKERFLNDPTFNGIAAKNLKLILKRLQKISEDGGNFWDEAMAIKVFNRFLTLAFADKWLQDNFILNTLYSKFDSIINKKNGSHQQRTQQNGTGKSAGANELLNELSAEIGHGTGFGIAEND